MAIDQRVNQGTFVAQDVWCLRRLMKRSFQVTRWTGGNFHGALGLVFRHDMPRHEVGSGIPSGNLTQLLKMAIYSEFSHSKW